MGVWEGGYNDKETSFVQLEPDCAEECSVYDHNEEVNDMVIAVKDVKMAVAVAILRA